MEFVWTVSGRSISVTGASAVSYGFVNANRDVGSVTIGSTQTYWLPRAATTVDSTAGVTVDLSSLRNTQKNSYSCTRPLNMSGGQLVYSLFGQGHSYICVNNQSVTGQVGAYCAGFSNGRMTGAADGDNFNSSCTLLSPTTCFDSCAASRLATANPGAYNGAANNCYHFTQSLRDACNSECGL